ncbi:fibronectin type III domain-containing protein [Candidatus Uhrbacteria bacterium]|nr:fibronectin type III domain-containing protein [Candidatus Uhrbacteria bacterium]
MLPPPPPGAPVQPPTGSGPTNVGPEIVVIPEKYYGVALKMEGKTQAEMAAPVAPKPVAPLPPKVPMPGPLPKRPIWPFVLLIIVLLLLVAGGFVWFNRELLFKKPTPTPVTPPVVVRTPPNAASNLTASFASGTTAVSLAWIDSAGDETGYRLERRETGGTYVPVTNLPSNSTSFLDVSVQGGRSYSYRVTAIGAGGESQPSNEATVSVDLAAPAPVVPVLPPGGLDSDSDGLSDVEETVFGTDSRVPDTDRDGFLDGNEVFHLYNPAATAPVRLVDSGLVTPLVAPAGWSIYVPKGWTFTLDAADGSKATIRSGQGEVFRVELVDNAQHLALLEWYLAANPGIPSTSARAITTKGGLEGLLGADRLDAFFAWDGKVFKIVYDNGTKPFINFRTSFEMILNSLRLSGAPVLSPEVVNATLQGPGDFISTTSSATTTQTP